LGISDGQACFYVIVQGRCSLHLSGMDSAVALNGGDLVVLLHDKPHTLSSGPCGRESSTAFPGHADSLGDAGLQKGALIRGTFACDPDEIVSMIPQIPPVILADGKDGSTVSWIAGAAHLIANESASGQPGAQAMINDLVHLIFTHYLRARPAAEFSGDFRISELFHRPQIGLALYQMQARLHESWSVTALARACGMSRSAFAYEFKNVVGLSPMSYLFELRMRAACRKLRDDGMKIKDVCESIGYRSQPSFTHAFTGRMGMAPGAYRKAHTADVPGDTGESRLFAWDSRQ
jgi:AraC-like DNA-binding protein